MTDLVAALRASIERAREARQAEDRCPVAACRGSLGHTTRVTEDGEPERYGYCTTCGLAVS